MAARPRSAAEARTGTRLRGRWLLLARAAWLTVVLLAVGIFVAGLISLWPELRTVCTRGAEVCRNEGRPTPEDLRNVRELGLPAVFYAAYDTALNVIFAAVWWAVAAVIFARRSDDPMALLVSLFLVTYGPLAFGSVGPYVLAENYPAFRLPIAGVGFVGWVCFALFFCLFPSGRFAPHWIRWLALAFLAMMGSLHFFPDSRLNPQILFDVPGPLLLAPFALGFVAAQVYRYRRVSGLVEREQTRWVVFGITLAFGGFFGVIAVPFGDPSSILFYFATFAAVYGFMMLIPLSIGFAMLRSGLFDIDVVINRTLVYTMLTASLALVYVGGVAGLQRLLPPLVGESNQLAVVASTLAIAALFTPLRRRIQTFIDRIFYRRKYDAQKTLAAFSARLREEADLESLNEGLVSAVRETVQPEHISLWLRPPEDFSGRSPS